MSAEAPVPAASPLTRGVTPRELSRRWRCSHDRIREWIRAGVLKAINLAPTNCGRPRFVVLPEHLAEFEAKRQAAPATTPRRKSRNVSEVDYFPD
jgi:hypothetical protein